MTPAPIMNFPPQEDAGHRRIPFEYAFEFVLDGKQQTLKQSVAVSVEGGFSATSIGYGFVSDAPGVAFGPISSAIFFGGVGSALHGIPFGDILAGAQKALGSRADFGRGRTAGEAAGRVGIQINPDVADLAFQGDTLSDRVLNRLFRVAGNDAGDVLFLYALFDGGTGRAFQSDPILNIAGLGTSNGERPFRQFSPPIEFDARSTIDLEITPLSNHFGRLFVALQGYKVLGGAGTPTSPANLRRPHRRGR